MVVAPQAGSTARKKLAQGIDLLCKAILGFLVLSLLATSYPFRPWEPIWFLKLSQIAIDYGVSYLLAVLLAKLNNYYRSDDPTVIGSQTFLKRVLSAGFAVYLAFIPIQVFGFALYWVQTNQQANQALKTAEQQVEKLRTGIRTVQSTEELRNLLGINPKGESAGIKNTSSLAGEQAKALQAVDSQLMKLRAQLKQNRTTRIARLSIDTGRGIIGAGIFAIVLARIRRLWGSP